MCWQSQQTAVKDKEFLNYHMEKRLIGEGKIWQILLA